MKKFKSLFTLTGLAFVSLTASANTFIQHSLNDYSLFKNQLNQTVKVEVIESQGESWKKYSNFLNQGERWLWTRSDSNQVITTDFNQVELFVDFDAPVNKVYDLNWNSCVQTAQITEKNKSMSLGNKRLSDVVEISFAGDCRDAGLTKAWVAPRLGVIAWEELSIMGNIKYTAVEIKLGDSLMKTSESVAVNSSFSSQTLNLSSNEEFEGYIHLTNNTSSPISFTFASGHIFDIDLVDENNQVVAQWSDGLYFTQALKKITIEAGESIDFGGKLKMTEEKKSQLTEGIYKIKVRLKGYYTNQMQITDEMSYSVEAPIYLHH